MANGLRLRKSPPPDKLIYEGGRVCLHEGNEKLLTLCDIAI